MKIKLGVTYRELIDWLGEMPRLQEALGLRHLPHFTAVQKAFARSETAVWQVLQRPRTRATIPDRELEGREIALMQALDLWR